MKTIVRRTFEALRHPIGSPERAKLNQSAETSEYLTGERYLIVETNFMSDGSINPTQPFTSRGFRTKKAAMEAFDI